MENHRDEIQTLQMQQKLYGNLDEEMKDGAAGAKLKRGDDSDNDSVMSGVNTNDDGDQTGRKSDDNPRPTIHMQVDRDIKTQSKKEKDQGHRGESSKHVKQKIED